jgi:hypothetical protein
MFGAWHSALLVTVASAAALRVAVVTPLLDDVPLLDEVPLLDDVPLEEVPLLDDGLTAWGLLPPPQDASQRLQENRRPARISFASRVNMVFRIPAGIKLRRDRETKMQSATRQTICRTMSQIRVNRSPIRNKIQSLDRVPIRS